MFSITVIVNGYVNGAVVCEAVCTFIGKEMASGLFEVLYEGFTSHLSIVSILEHQH